MKPTITQTEAFRIWGKGIRTTNEAGKSIQDQGALWGKLMSEGFLNPVPKKNGMIIGAYHSYEGDHTKPFSFALGAEAPADAAFDGAACGLEALTLPAGRYAVFTGRKGPPQEVIGELWQAVWDWSAASAEKRAYTFDYEVWDGAELAEGRAAAKVFIALK